MHIFYLYCRVFLLTIILERYLQITLFLLISWLLVFRSQCNHPGILIYIQTWPKWPRKHEHNPLHILNTKYLYIEYILSTQGVLEYTYHKIAIVKFQLFLSKWTPILIQFSMNFWSTLVSMYTCIMSGCVCVWRVSMSGLYYSVYLCICFWSILLCVFVHEGYLFLVMLPFTFSEVWGQLCTLCSQCKLLETQIGWDVEALCLLILELLQVI